MTRSRQVSPVPEIGTPGLKWRGLETAYGKPKRARSRKRRIQPRGAYGALRQSSTLLKKSSGAFQHIPEGWSENRTSKLVLGLLPGKFIINLRQAVAEGPEAD